MKPPTLRDRILDAATHLFAGDGYRGATIRNICALAKCSIGAVYDHFKSKEDLFSHVFRLLGDDVKTKLAAAAKLPTDAARTEHLAKTCFTNVEFMRLLVVDDLMHVGEGARFAQQLQDIDTVTPHRMKHIVRALRRAAGLLWLDASFTLLTPTTPTSILVSDETCAWTASLFSSMWPDLHAA
mgnify:CR=1 FL=1